MLMILTLDRTERHVWDHESAEEVHRHKLATADMLVRLKKKKEKGLHGCIFYEHFVSHLPLLEPVNFTVK